MLATLFGSPTKEGLEVESGRRLTKLRFSDNLNQNKTQTIMKEIKQFANTSFYVRYSHSYWLRNIEDGSLLLYYINRQEDSRWVNHRADAEEWIQEMEDERLRKERIKRDSTKWVWEAPSDVFIKLIYTRQPLMGTGPLPEWLRSLAHGRHGPMVCLDTYQDSLCL